ncbi:MAG: hypothetical protein K5868_08945 [Lachnospiraceae bacterium]|nr:hypothetical protein [Lachnospiraceae bacterium]
MSNVLLNFLVILITNVVVIIYIIVSGRSTKRYINAQTQKYGRDMGGYFGTRKSKGVGRGRGSSACSDDGYEGGQSASSNVDDSRHVIWDTPNGKCTDQYGYSYDTWGNPLDSDNPYGHL